MNKENERAKLHNTIWQMAQELRGSVDGWDFKQYVLGMLFYRYISENLTKYINDKKIRLGHAGFNYENISDEEANNDRKEIVLEKGFYILPSELFVNINKNAKDNRYLHKTLEKVFKDIEMSAKGYASENDLKGLFDELDVNSNKLGYTVAKRNEVLLNLLNSIGELDLGNYNDNAIDIIGDAYEYLIGMYASFAGKSGGEFFTPQEVSELLARITVVGKTEVNKVYDPACGSGSLLLKFAKVLGKNNVKQGFFGQEINLTNFNLCRINMFLHNIDHNKFKIEHGNTLTDPKHIEDEPFDAIVSNPPYSINWEGDSNPNLINDSRFSPAGVLAPKSKADLAFAMHILSYLSETGTAAIVEFPGVLYRGGAEQKIRKYLVDNNFIDTIIKLPPDLFFGTTIATCIIILKKNKVDKKVLYIDATNETIRSGNKNKLTYDNINKILYRFVDRKNESYFSKLVDYENIVKNDYDLSVNLYVKRYEQDKLTDIVKINDEINKSLEKQDNIRNELKEIISRIEGETNE